MEKVVLHIRVPAEMRNTLQKFADADRRMLSDYVRLVLEDHIFQKEHDTPVEK